MKLTKFIRQNSRTLLMVFMSLLLVAFLVPNTITGLTGRERAPNTKLGKVFGRTVTSADVQRVSADLQLLSRFELLPRLPDEAVLDYHLLMEEARYMGVRVARDEVEAGLAAAGVTEDRLREIQRYTHRSRDQIFDIIGRWVAAQRLMALQAGAIVESLPREELAYRDRTQEAVAPLSVIDDKAFVHLVPEPTEEQLQAFFEECKGRRTAHTADELQFGYLLPDRVRVEYLTVDPQKIKSRITVQAVQVKRYFEDNAQRYTKPDPLTTQPVEGQFPQVPMTYEEARGRVREDFREARAVETAQRLVNDLYTEAHQPWSASTRGEDGFTILPEKSISFEELRERFSMTYEVEYGQTDLLGADKLGQIPGLGSTAVRVGRQALRMPEIALRAKGILATDPNDGKPVLNVLEPAPVVVTSKMDPQTRESTPYQAFLFRVLQAAPSAPPESLEPIRAEVVADWKLLQAHELAGARAEVLALRARQVGLAAAVEESTDLKEIFAAAERAASQPAAPTVAPAAARYLQDLEPAAPPRLTRELVADLRVLGAKSLAPAIFALADTPTDDTAPYRVTSLPLAYQFKWVVAELAEIKPLYEGPFEAQLAQAVQSSESSERERFSADWLAPKNVAERTGFVLEPGREPRGR